MQRELKHFQFPDFLGREFPYITVKGLVYQEGNRQIEVSVRSDGGDGFVSGQWRRHAKLTLLVPKCQRVGVRGGLGGFKVHDLNADLAVRGHGNPEENSVYEVVNLGGSLSADNMPIHRIEGVKGDASVTATAFSERRDTRSRPDATNSVYRNITGDLRARLCLAYLTIGDVGGKIDVENDFGDVVWETDRELAQKAAHRIVSQSGAITVPSAPRHEGI